MEQMLLFDYCKPHYKTTKKFHWIYWKTDCNTCEECFIRYSIKKCKEIISFLKEREKRRLRDKNPIPMKKISRHLRNRVRFIIKSNKIKKTFSKSKSIGCSPDELKQHLESKFKSGMTWENYGKIWHVDHVKPVSKFDLFNNKELEKINHYTNLQPLFAEENLKKSNNYYESKLI